MTPADRQIFNFNMSNLNWELYLENMMPGLRLYLAKDPMDTLDEGREKFRRRVIFISYLSKSYYFLSRKPYL